MKYGINNIEQISRYCYYAGLGIGFIGIISLLLVRILDLHIGELIPDCYFYVATGYYCPGCGGTRSVYALLQGNIFLSIYYHSFVVYIFIYYIVFEVSHTLSIITRGKIKGILFCPYFFYVGIALVIIQCVLKNYLRFYYGFSL